MITVPDDIDKLCRRLGHERTSINVGDEIIGMGCSTSMGHFLTYGKIIGIQGNTAQVQLLHDYFFSGGSFPRVRQVDVSIDYLKKSIATKSREHIEFWDWFAKELTKK